MVYSLAWHFLHDRAPGGIKRLGPFLWRFLLMTLRLIPTLVVIAAILYIGLTVIASSRDALGGTVEMLMPIFMLVALNLALWLARFFKGLRRGLTTVAWRPAGAPAAEAPLQPELP